MGNFTGRKSPGKYFSCIRQYFAVKPVGYQFQCSEAHKILRLFQKLNPDTNVNTITGVMDGVRTLTGKGLPFKKVTTGLYELVREFDFEKDDRFFQRKYPEKAAKGKQYRAMKRKEKESVPVAKELHSDIKALGEGKTKYSYDKPDSSLLEAFPSPFSIPELNPAGVLGTLNITCPEFTSLCPKTGQPDFAVIVIDYVPDKWCVESKSLKLYLGSFRNHGEFHESCVNRIANDIIKLLDPIELTVIGKFTPRGGIPFWPKAYYKKG